MPRDPANFFAFSNITHFHDRLFYSQLRKPYNNHIISFIRSFLYHFVCINTSIIPIFVYLLRIYPRCQYLQQFCLAAMLVHQVIFSDFSVQEKKLGNLVCLDYRRCSHGPMTTTIGLYKSLKRKSQEP